MSSSPQVFPASDQRRDFEFEVTDDLQDLLAVLPPHIKDRILALQSRIDLGELIEIVMDLGRRPKHVFNTTKSR